MSDAMWAQSLESTKSQLERLEGKSRRLACRYCVYSESIGGASKEFNEIEQSLRQPDTLSDPLIFSYELFHNESKVEAIFPFWSELLTPRIKETDLKNLAKESRQLFQQTFEREYKFITEELLDILFDGEENAKKLLGVNETFEGRDAIPQRLWTLILFRLATLKISGSRLRLSQTDSEGDAFQTLWPFSRVSGDIVQKVYSYEMVPLCEPNSEQVIYFPAYCRGRGWILSEIQGTLHWDGENGNVTDNVVMRFSPPFVLQSIAPISPDTASSTMFGWSGQHNGFPTITVFQQDGDELTEMASMRFSEVRSSIDGEDKRGENTKRFMPYVPLPPLFLDGKTDIQTIYRPKPFEKVHVGTIPQTGIRIGLQFDRNHKPADPSQLSSIKIARLNIKFAQLPPQEEPPKQEAAESDEERIVRDSMHCYSHDAPRLQRDLLYFGSDWTTEAESYEEPDDDEEMEETFLKTDEYGDWIKVNQYGKVTSVPTATVKTRMIRLENAEKLLKAIHRGEDHLALGDDLGVDAYWDYLPQQRITNVVQEIDGLFDASIKAVDLALVKGKEWFRRVIEQTAPLFNEVWKDGIFTSEKSQRLDSQLRKVNLDSTSDNPQKISSESPKAKKTMRDYSEEDKEKMIDRAIAFKRRNQWASNVFVAIFVARKWEGFKNNHLTRLGEKGRHSSRYKRFVKSLKKETESNMTVQRGESDNTTPEQEAELREYDELVSGYLVKIGVPVNLIQSEHQKFIVIDYLTNSINGFDQALSNVIFGEAYTMENEGHVQYSEEERDDDDDKSSKKGWLSSQNYVPTEKDIRAFVKTWVEERNCAMDK